MEYGWIIAPSVKMFVDNWCENFVEPERTFAIFIYFKRNALLSEVPDTDWIQDR